MNKSAPLIITISRQFGSGGSFIGQQLAKRLNIYYADHEILSKTAERLSLVEDDISSRDEKVIGLWKSFMEISTYGLGSDGYTPPRTNYTSSEEVFHTESEVIRDIAKEQSAVIIGRCGFHILREHQNLVKIFFHADKSFRSKRIQEIYKVSDFEAREMIAKMDKERARYIKAFSGADWTNAALYDLSFDTGKIAFDKIVELIKNYIKE